MSRLLIILVCSFFCQSLDAQTFSLITDPIQGDETDFHNNAAFDLQLLEDRVVLAGQHSCHSPSGDGGRIFCASLSTFDFEGNLLNGVLLDTFFDGSPGSLLTVDDRIFTANFKHRDPFLGRELYVQEYDINLNLVKQTTIPTRANLEPNNCGIKYINDHFYIYGDVIKDRTSSKGFIQKLDKDLNLIWDKQYTHGGVINGCDKLQETIDKNFIYIHKFEEENTAGDYNGLQIVKLDSNGIKLDSLEIEGAGTFGSTLFSDQLGAIYTYTYFHPFDYSIFEQSQGRINKYNSDLDSLIWSLKLPYNAFLNRREFFVSYTIEAKNGDILACGSVLDNTENGPQIVNHYGVNCFIIRISKEGEIKWFHIYKSPNLIKSLPVEEFGVYHDSGLGRMAELEDGRILAAGVSRLNNDQNDIVVGTTDPWSQFLILAVDGATGCIDGEECDEIIVLDGKYDPRDDFLPIVNSSNKWTVEYTDTSGSSDIISYTFYNDTTILELFNIHNDRLVTTTGNSSPVKDGEFREVRGKVYQKLGGLNSTKENFLLDISIKEGEHITVDRQDGPRELIAISTDTIILLDNIPRKRIQLQCSSGTAPQDTIVWIEGIGELDNSKVCDFNGQRNEILCVQDSLGNPIYSLFDKGCGEIYTSCPPTSFSVGDKWTYTKHNYPAIEFLEYNILDEIEWMGKQALVIKPGLWHTEDYMYEEDGRVYFWDYGINDYQLNYDFNNDSLYYIKYFNNFTLLLDSTIVYVDSTVIEEFNGQQIEVQYIRSDFGDSYGSPPPYSNEVIKNVGQKLGGPRLWIGNLINDCFGACVGDIRCFESLDCNIQFVDYPCDSLFNTTATKDLQEISDIQIYPNPTQDKLYIDGNILNYDYQILSLQGQQMLQGKYQDHIAVDQLPSGIYFLQLSQEAQLYKAIKFVKE